MKKCFCFRNLFQWHRGWYLMLQKYAVMHHWLLVHWYMSYLTYGTMPLMNLHSQFSRATQISFIHKIPSQQLTARFPTSRDNRAVVTRAKSCSYKFVKIWIRKRWFSAKFLITSYKHVVREVHTWVPGNWEPDSVRLSGVGDGMYRAPWGGTFWQQVRKRNMIYIIFHLKLAKPRFNC